MAKQKKQDRVIESVTLKNSPLILPRLGMKITEENLTIERYEKLISISPSFQQYFNVKTKKQDEIQTEK